MRYYGKRRYKGGKPGRRHGRKPVRRIVYKGKRCKKRPIVYKIYEKCGHHDKWDKCDDHKKHDCCRCKEDKKDWKDDCDDDDDHHGKKDWKDDCDDDHGKKDRKDDCDCECHKHKKHDKDDCGKKVYRKTRKKRCIKRYSKCGKKGSHGSGDIVNKNTNNNLVIPIFFPYGGLLDQQMSGSSVDDDDYEDSNEMLEIDGLKDIKQISLGLKDADNNIIETYEVPFKPMSFFKR